MLSDKVRKFLSQNHQAVLTTFRANGAAQMSIITVGRYRDGVAFTTTAGRAKLANLVREPRCSLLVSKQDWWGYVVLQGRAKVLASDNTDAAELRQTLRDVYRAAAGKTICALLERGRITPDVSDVFAFADCADAHNRVEAGTAGANVVIVPSI